MQSVDYYDKHLDPPEEPSHSPCDGCGETFDNGDLRKINGQWLCEECIGKEYNFYLTETD